MTQSLMLAALALMLTLLAACGVDGAPTRPDPAPATPGLHVSGEARIGVTTAL
ncbi:MULTISPECIES: hypothetical protein [unclassified Paracoccus (in: a-proteobacteria)]|uniref:hypothetical protein n=1 Tax=unclassified Paracoccus (in: a-proteobacteria) TaxID=2688777 RepID=UPI0018A6AD2F|nr:MULTISPECIES: hypothetical protein [unclassified Paracoccus (in: a-proteobacteria)]UXU75061.1 hypothetical protein GB879_000755 [Paracoccus sp. SMMA_5]UXU80964.1 hypothetical protein GB880_000755 [Paracoccus sp. SMMA_5_TC]